MHGLCGDALIARLALAIVFALLGASCNRSETYNKRCQTRSEGWRSFSAFQDPHGTFNTVTIHETGRLTLDDAFITTHELKRALAEIGQIDPTPAVSLRIAPGASCASVKEVRKIIEDARNCAEGFKCYEDQVL